MMHRIINLLNPLYILIDENDDFLSYNDGEVSTVAPVDLIDISYQFDYDTDGVIYKEKVNANFIKRRILELLPEKEVRVVRFNPVIIVYEEDE